MAGNSTLLRAQSVPADEYYTLYSDIEKEVGSYPPSTFKGKIVYCNADGKTSNFYKFFKTNFKSLGLKKLICTSYSKWGCIIDRNGETVLRLKDGDYRSPECMDYMAQANIIVTNPPFSLMNDYVQRAIASGKKFLIVAPQSITHYTRIFPYFARHKIRPGNTRLNQFIRPDGVKVHFGNIYWFTNLPTKRKSPVQLTETYDAKRYPKYDNINAINIPNITSIPKDYHGDMGVPESIFFKDWEGLFTVKSIGRPWLDGKELFCRIIIRRKQ